MSPPCPQNAAGSPADRRLAGVGGADQPAEGVIDMPVLALGTEIGKISEGKVGNGNEAGRLIRTPDRSPPRIRRTVTDADVEPP